MTLKEGQAVVVEGRNASGTADYHIRCLPADFPTWTETRSGDDRQVVHRHAVALARQDARSYYVAIFDGNGVPVWWYKANGPPLDAKLLPGPTIAFATFLASVHAYQVRSLDGTLVRRIVSPDGAIDDHELQRTPNGDYVYLVYDPKQHVDLTRVRRAGGRDGARGRGSRRSRRTGSSSGGGRRTAMSTSPSRRAGSRRS